MHIKILHLNLHQQLVPYSDLAKTSNVRDYATINELTVLSNLESHNAELIKEGKK